MLGRLPRGASIEQVASRAEVIASRLRTGTRIRIAADASFSRRLARAEAFASLRGRFCSSLRAQS